MDLKPYGIWQSHDKVLYLSEQCILHSFVIDKNNVDVNEEIAYQGPFQQGVAPHIVADQVEGMYPLAPLSGCCSILVQLIEQDDHLTWPAHNLL